MKDYQRADFYNQVPPYLLYLCMMGQGSVYRMPDGIVMNVAISQSRLPCGCAGMDHYRLVDSKGEKVLEKLTHEEHEAYRGQALESINFQSKENEAFWEGFYKTNPHCRPISMARSLV